MMTRINRDQAHALAQLIHLLRDDWDIEGIVAKIGTAKDRGTAWDVIHAALYAAENPTNRTPAVIGYAGPHWTRGHALGDRSPIPGAREPRCETHPWQPLDACSACRSEQIAAPDEQTAAPTLAITEDQAAINERGAANAKRALAHHTARTTRTKEQP